MTSTDFFNTVQAESKEDYGLCPPPTKAEKGLDVLIDHFLGSDWYTTLPLSKEQMYTEAIYEILERNKKPRTFLSKLFSLKK